MSASDNFQPKSKFYDWNIYFCINQSELDEESEESELDEEDDEESSESELNDISSNCYSFYYSNNILGIFSKNFLKSSVIAPKPMEVKKLIENRTCLG